MVIFGLGWCGGSLASAQTTNRLARPDFSEFKIVTERNIFNPKRYARSGPQSRPPAPKVVETVSLTGTMSYSGKGPFAFFDSSSSDYRKVAKVSDSIAGYKIQAIQPTVVKLSSGTNELEMGVGMQLRREESGSWELTGTQAGGTNGTSSGLSAADASETGTNAPAGSSDTADNDPVLKKLMERRNQENNR
jgi:hypothetical protein